MSGSLRLYRIRHKESGFFFNTTRNVAKWDWTRRHLQSKGFWYHNKPNVIQVLGKHIFNGDTKSEDWEIVEYNVTEVVKTLPKMIRKQ